MIPPVGGAFSLVVGRTSESIFLLFTAISKTTAANSTSAGVKFANGVSDSENSMAHFENSAGNFANNGSKRDFNVGNFADDTGTSPDDMRARLSHAPKPSNHLPRKKTSHA